MNTSHTFMNDKICSFYSFEKCIGISFEKLGQPEPDSKSKPKSNQI